MRMPKWIWVFLALGISSGIYFSIRYGLRPKPIPQLNPTVFDSPDQIGVVTYRALRASLRAERVLVLGSDTAIQGYQDIWNGFVHAAVADGIKMDTVFERSDLQIPEALKTAKVSEVKPEEIMSAEFTKEIQNAYQSGEMAVIQILNIEATHLTPGTLTRRLQQLPNLPVISISMLPLAVNQQGLDQLEPRCVDPRNDDKPEDRFACAASRISRRYLRKHLPADKWVAAIERHGLKEYLLFISMPHPPQAAESKN